MSLCRFSSDGWRSDVYVYEHYRGFIQTHVAGRRIEPYPEDDPCPDPPDPGEEPTATQIMEWRRHQDKWLDKYHTPEHMEVIDHPEAGANRSFQDPEDAEKYLRSLVDEGFHVPDYVFEQLKEYEEKGLAGKEE